MQISDVLRTVEATNGVALETTELEVTFRVVSSSLPHDARDEETDVHRVVLMPEHTETEAATEVHYMALRVQGVLRGTALDVGVVLAVHQNTDNQWTVDLNPGGSTNRGSASVAVLGLRSETMMLSVGPERFVEDREEADRQQVRYVAPDSILRYLAGELTEEEFHVYVEGEMSWETIERLEQELADAYEQIGILGAQRVDVEDKLRIAQQQLTEAKHHKETATEAAHLCREKSKRDEERCTQLDTALTVAREHVAEVLGGVNDLEEYADGRFRRVSKGQLAQRCGTMRRELQAALNECDLIGNDMPAGPHESI